MTNQWRPGDRLAPFCEPVLPKPKVPPFRRREVRNEYRPNRVSHPVETLRELFEDTDFDFQEKFWRNRIDNYVKSRIRQLEAEIKEYKYGEAVNQGELEARAQDIKKLRAENQSLQARCTEMRKLIGEILHPHIP